MLMELNIIEFEHNKRMQKELQGLALRIFEIEGFNGLQAYFERYYRLLDEGKEIIDVYLEMTKSYPTYISRI
jgi:hypothetical protein